MNLTNHRMHSHNHSRMDVLQAIGVHPSQLQPHLMNQMETFPKDYHPPQISKKFFAPAYVYKHVYLGDNNKEQPMMVMTKIKKKVEMEEEEEEEEKEEEKEDSMMESLDPFGCESEEEEDDEEEDDESESDEYGMRRKYKSKTKSKKSKKKKKKKILLKILLAVLAVIAVKCLLAKFSIYPTTGRDELQESDDQLYHEGIDIDRSFKDAEAEYISKTHQAFFSPNYDETRIRKSSS